MSYQSTRGSTTADGRRYRSNVILLLLNKFLRRIWFRPRILRDVATVDFSTRILGHPTKTSIYLGHMPSYFVLKRDVQTATALGKLGHPDGELNPQMVDLFRAEDRILLTTPRFSDPNT